MTAVVAAAAIAAGLAWLALRLAHAAGLYEHWLDAMGRDETEGPR